MLKYSFRLSLGQLTIALVNASSSNTIVGTICVTKKSKVSGAKPAFNLAKCLTAETYIYFFFSGYYLEGYSQQKPVLCLLLF